MVDVETAAERGSYSHGTHWRCICAAAVLLSLFTFTFLPSWHLVSHLDQQFVSSDATAASHHGSCSHHPATTGAESTTPEEPDQPVESPCELCSLLGSFALTQIEFPSTLPVKEMQEIDSPPSVAAMLQWIDGDHRVRALPSTPSRPPRSLRS